MKRLIEPHCGLVLSRQLRRGCGWKMWNDWNKLCQGMLLRLAGMCINERWDRPGIRCWPPFANLACNVHYPALFEIFYQFRVVGDEYLPISQYNRKPSIRFKHRNKPCMLMNWPNFNAAPLICDNFDTSRFIFASVIMSEEGCSPCSAELVERRTISDAAP